MAKPFNLFQTDYLCLESMFVGERTDQIGCYCYKAGTVIKIGDWVILKILPPWVSQLPPESQAVFKFCVGRTYRLVDIDQHGHLVLDVSPDIDHHFEGYGHDIRVEKAYVALAKRS